MNAKPYEVTLHIGRLAVLAKLSTDLKDLLWWKDSSDGFRTYQVLSIARVARIGPGPNPFTWRPWVLFVGPLALKAGWVTKTPKENES